MEASTTKIASFCAIHWVVKLKLICIASSLRCLKYQMRSGIANFASKGQQTHNRRLFQLPPQLSVLSRTTEQMEGFHFIPTLSEGSSRELQQYLVNFDESMTTMNPLVSFADYQNWLCDLQRQHLDLNEYLSVRLIILIRAPRRSNLTILHVMRLHTV